MSKTKSLLAIIGLVLLVVIMESCGDKEKEDNTGGYGTDTIAPTTPTSLTANATSSNEINLLWNQSTDNVSIAGYKVYRNGMYLKSVTSTSTSDTELNSGKQYCYKVSSYDEAENESGISNEACTTTQVFWAKTYGGTGEDLAKFIQQTSDGGYVVVGGTEGDIWVLKLDLTGDIQWQKTYGGTNFDWAPSIQQTSDGGYVVAGGTEGDIWVLKLDLNGNIQWQKTYGGTSWEFAYFIQQTNDGGYVIAGKTETGIWVLKLDLNGNIQWQKTYGGTNSGWASSIQQTSDGGYVIIGGTSSFGVGSNDVWALKLDLTGDIQWQKTYGGTNSDWASSIQQTSDGGYIVAGQTASFGAGSNDVWVLKLDSNGKVQWRKAYGGTGDDQAKTIQQTSDGGYVVAGQTTSFGAGSNDVWVLKLDLTGDIQWQKTYGGIGDDRAKTIQQTSDGGYVVVGQTTSFGAGVEDVWVLKLYPDGSITFNSSSGAATIDTNATIADTPVNGVTTNAIVKIPTITVNTIYVIGIDTNATVKQQAP